MSKDYVLMDTYSGVAVLIMVLNFLMLIAGKLSIPLRPVTDEATFHPILSLQY